MANKKVSPSEPVSDSSGQASKVPWTAGDRLTDPDSHVLLRDDDPHYVEATGLDTTPGYLNDKLVASSPLATGILTPGADEQVSVSLTTPGDGDQVLLGTSPGTFGPAPLKHTESEGAPAYAIPNTLTQPTGFSVSVPADGTYLLTYSGTFTSDGAGVANVDLYNGTSSAKIGSSGRAQEVAAAAQGGLSTQAVATLASGATIYPRWSFTGGNNATLDEHGLSLVRLGT